MATVRAAVWVSCKTNVSHHILSFGIYATNASLPGCRLPRPLAGSGTHYGCPSAPTDSVAHRQVRTGLPRRCDDWQMRVPGAAIRRSQSVRAAV